MESRTADIQGQPTDGNELEPLGAVGEKIARPEVSVIYVILQRGKRLDPTAQRSEGWAARWRAGNVRRFWGQTGEPCDFQIRIGPSDILVPRLPRSEDRLLSGEVLVKLPESKICSGFNTLAVTRPI